MDKRIKIFIIILVLSIIAAYWAALKLDTFATGIVASIPTLYFVTKALKSLWQLIKRQEVRTNLVIGLGSILGFLLMTHACGVVSFHGIRELTEQRKQTLNELRPILMKYKEENGCYPNKLQDLTPKYLHAIPPELVNDGKDDYYKKITYEVINCEAQFIFYQMRGPDSRVTYHISKNTYEYEQ
jgi:hypothetical protein